MTHQFFEDQPASPPATATSIELSEEELRELIDSEARDRLGISGDELLEAAASGTLKDADDVADLLILADVLLDARPPLAA